MRGCNAVLLQGQGGELLCWRVVSGAKDGHLSTCQIGDRGGGRGGGGSDEEIQA